MKIIKLVALPLLLTLTGCAAVVSGIGKEMSNKVYQNEAVKRKDVKDKRVAVLPLDVSAYSRDPVGDSAQYADMPGGDARTFDANQLLLDSDSAWTTSFNEHYMPHIVTVIHGAKPVTPTANGLLLSDEDYRTVVLTVNGEEKSFKIPVRTALVRNGLDSEFALVLTRLHVVPTARRYVEGSMVIFGRKEVDLDFQIEYALYDYENERMVSCGSFADDFEQSRLAPVTKFKARVFADKIVRLTKVLDEPEVDKSSSTGF